MYYFWYKVLKFTDHVFFLLLKGIHFFCTRSLIIRYKNQLALGGYLQEKRQINGT